MMEKLYSCLNVRKSGNRKRAVTPYRVSKGRWEGTDHKERNSLLLDCRVVVIILAVHNSGNEKNRKLPTPHINDSFCKQQHKIPPNQKNKNIKNQRIGAKIDFIQILIILNTVAVLSCAQERKWMVLRRNTMSSCVNTMPSCVNT